MEEIQALIEKELGLENVDQEVREKVIGELGAVVLERMLVTLLLTDEDETMQTMLKEGKLVEALDYAEANFPYMNEVLSSVASEVILEYKSAA
jgi:hypothetical protein